MTHAFRLASLQKLRIRERDRAGVEVSEAQRAIQLLDEKLRSLQEEHRSMDSLRRHSSHGSMDLGSILNAQRFQMVLAAEQSQLQRDRSLLVQELERRQLKLLACQKAVKALEKLEERHDLEQATREQSRAQSRLDEWSQVQSVLANRWHP